MMEPRLPDEIHHGPGTSGPPSLTPNGWEDVVGVILACVLVIGTFELIEASPDLMRKPGAPFVTAILVAALGKAFYMIRENARRAYARLELGTAMASAFWASNKLAADSARTAGFFALLTAIYVAVRAFDNFDKAKQEPNQK